MSHVRIIAIALAAILVAVLVLYAHGDLGRFLCRHGQDGWLERHGFIMCHRAF